MMKSSTRKFAAVSAVYQVAVGLVLFVVGVLSKSWLTMVFAVALVIAGLATGLGRGEATSWLRGDLDERRRHAVDHAFRVAFLTLAWWVAALAIYSGSHQVTTGAWAAGNGVAIVVAYIDFALVLRRT